MFKLLYALAFAIWIFVVSIFLSCCAPHDKSNFHSRIASIGGCDSSAMCGVKLENGTILSDVRQPVIGSYPDCTKEDTCHEVLQ
jgi:hypothetical protein